MARRAHAAAHRLAAAATLIALALGSTRAGAQTGRPEVDALLRDAIALRESGRDLDALPHFESAYAQAPGPVTAAQLGLVLQALGRWAAAEPYLREALEATTDPWIARRRAALERAYATNQQHVGLLELVGGVEGATVRIDGAVVGQMPLAGPIAAPAGTVTLEIEAPRRYPLTRQVQIVAGARTREAIELRPRSTAPSATVAATSSASEPPAPQPTAPGPRAAPRAAVVVVARPPAPRPPRAARSAPTPTRPDRAPAEWRRPAALIAFGGAAVLLGAGIAATVVRENLAGAFNADPQCPSDTWMGVPACRMQFDTAVTATGLAIAAYAFGGAALAAGVALLVWPRPARHGDRGHAALRVACTPSLGSGGIGCAGTF